MDIVAVQRELKSAGFPIEMSDIQSLLEELRLAIDAGKVRRSSILDGGDKFKLLDVLKFLLRRDKTSTVKQQWDAAVLRNPKLADLKVGATYCKTPLQKGKVPKVASLTLEGVIHLAAALRYKAKGALDTETIGWVYILKDAANKALKIGFSNDLETRLNQHRSSHPFLVPIGIFPANYRINETSLHHYLVLHRIEGTREWYEDSRHIRRLICQYFVDAGMPVPAFND